jgi:hypothetical protein
MHLGTRMSSAPQDRINDDNHNPEQHLEPGEILGHCHPFDPQLLIKNQKRIGMLSLLRIFDDSL